MHSAYIQDDVETNLKLNFVFFLDNFHQFLEFSQETRLLTTSHIVSLNQPKILQKYALNFKWNICWEGSKAVLNKRHYPKLKQADSKGLLNLVNVTLKTSFLISVYSRIY